MESYVKVNLMGLKFENQPTYKRTMLERMLIIDDDPDIATTLKLGIENASEIISKRIVLIHI